MNIVLDILRYVKENKIPMIRVAEAAGMVPQNIKKCITNNPKAETILKIANGLGVHPGVFFYDLDETASQGTSGNASAASPSASSSEGSQSSPSSSTSPQGEQGDIIAEGDPFRSKIDMHEGRMDFSHDPTPSPDVMQTTTFCPHCGKRVRVGVVLMAE